MKRRKGSELRKELIQTLKEGENSKDKYKRLRHFIYKYDSDGVVQMMLLMMENKFSSYCFQQRILELQKKNQISKMSLLQFKDKQPVSRHYQLVSPQGEGYSDEQEFDLPEEVGVEDLLRVDKELDNLLDIMKQIEKIQFQKDHLLEVYRVL